MSGPDSLRRGGCPGALMPMETGDGWLVRLHPPGGRLSAEALQQLAQLAADHGNGLVDITSRANLQIRGVRPETHPPLVAALLAAGLVAPDEGEGPYRPVLTGPLAGRDGGDLLDVAALARDVEARVRSVTGLPAKTLVLIDGGGLSPGAGSADLRLVALSGDQLALVVGARAYRITIGEAAEAVAVLLGRLAIRHRADPAVRRLRDVGAGEIAALAASLGLPATVVPQARRAGKGVGLVAETGGMSAALAAAPFGRLAAASLVDLAALVRRHGAFDLRLTPWRGVVLTGLTDAAGVLAELAGLGFIIDAWDSRLAVDACPGAPACARGAVPAQADAARFAAALGPDRDPHMSVHVSGCAKGCARPGRADVTLVGRDGLYDVVLGGRTSDPPCLRLDAAAVARLLAQAGNPAETFRKASPMTPATRSDHIKDGAAIYARSFAIIRAEADLAPFEGVAERIVVRMIHACGMTDLAGDVVMSEDFATAAEAALARGAPILCDAKMVANGVTPARLPARNRVICTLDDPRVPGLARTLATTRSAAAMAFWREEMAGSLVVIGNAPTSLFHLLDMLDGGAPLPAAVIGVPVGFVGAAESKEALAADGRVPFLIVRGRRGGSAMAAAAVNALASAQE